VSSLHCRRIQWSCRRRGELIYVSSMGLRSFISVAKVLRDKGGALRICRLNGLVKQVFEITGLLDTFPVYESVEAALIAG